MRDTKIRVFVERERQRKNSGCPISGPPEGEMGFVCCEGLLYIFCFTPDRPDHFFVLRELRDRGYRWIDPVNDTPRGMAQTDSRHGSEMSPVLA